MFKKVVTAGIFGALLGLGLTGWFAPNLITWYFAPPVEVAITCQSAVSWGIGTFRKFLLGGAGVGFVAGSIAWGVFSGRRKRNRELGPQTGARSSNFDQTEPAVTNTAEPTTKPSTFADKRW